MTTGAVAQKLQSLLFFSVRYFMSKIDLNVPSNSDASKAKSEQKAEKKPVANGKIEKKHKFFKRTLEVFSGENLETSAEDVIENVIVPALWDLLRESVHALWDKILDRADDTPRQSSYRRQDYRQQTSNGNYIPYGSAGARKRSNLGRRGDFIDTVYFRTREEADEALRALKDMQEEASNKEHFVSVEDFCSVANVKGDGNYMNSDWGWDDLTSAKVRHTLDGQYYITLPKVIPTPIKKNNNM